MRMNVLSSSAFCRRCASSVTIASSSIILLVHDGIAQNTDGRRFHFDHVAGHKPFWRIESRARSRRCSRRDEITRLQRREGREIFDQEIEREHHARGRIMLAHLAVDAGHDVERTLRQDFVRRDDPRTDRARAVEVLTLRDVELAVPEPIAHRALVAEREAENVAVRAFAPDATPFPADHNDDLALVIELLGDARAHDRLIVTDHRCRRAHEEARIFRPLRGGSIFRLAVLVIDADAPELLRIGDRRKKRYITERKIGPVRGGDILRASMTIMLDQRFQRREILADMRRQIDDAVTDDGTVMRPSAYEIRGEPHRSAPLSSIEPRRAGGELLVLRSRRQLALVARMAHHLHDEAQAERRQRPLPQFAGALALFDEDPVLRDDRAGVQLVGKMVDRAAGDRIALAHRPFDGRHAAMARQERGMITDAAEPGARNRIMGDARVAMRGDDEISAGRNRLEWHDMRVLVRVDLDPDGPRTVRQAIVRARDGDPRDLDPWLLQKQVEHRAAKISRTDKRDLHERALARVDLGGRTYAKFAREGQGRRPGNPTLREGAEPCREKSSISPCRSPTRFPPIRRGWKCRSLISITSRVFRISRHSSPG